MKKVLIRADASERVGVGHLMRSVALAQCFQKHGIYTRFVTFRWRDILCDYLNRQGFEVKFLDLTLDECGTKKDLGLFLDELGDEFDWVVLDNYYFGCDFQYAVRNSGARLLLIDDREGEVVCADLLIHYVREMNKREGISDQATEYCIGTDYVMIRKELSRFSVRQKRGLRNILVTLGGSSQNESLWKVIQAVNKIKSPFLHVKILGGFSESLASFSQKLTDSSLHRVEYCQATFEIEKLYDWADLAVCAGGGTCWELCFFGVVGIVGALIDHQLVVAEALERAGAFKSIGWYRSATVDHIAKGLEDLLKDPLLVQGMRERAEQLVDGNGPDRILEIMQRPVENQNLKEKKHA